MQGIVYPDDYAVVRLNVKKLWDDEGVSVGRTAMTIVPMIIDLTNVEDDGMAEDDDESLNNVIDLTMDDDGDYDDGNEAAI